VTRAYAAVVDGIAQVDEVVAGESVADPRHIAVPESRSRDAGKSEENLPAPDADVVWNHPRHIVRRPTGAAERLVDDVLRRREVGRDNLVAECVGVPVVPLGDLRRGENPVARRTFFYEDSAPRIGGALEDGL